MKWADWNAQYSAIVARFGYSVDNEARALEAGRAASEHPSVLRGTDAIAQLRSRLSGRCVVTGNSRSLERTMEQLNDSGELSALALVASDGSCGTLHRLGLQPSVVVTDLDGDLEAESSMNEAGAVLVVHFHGDNFELASSFVEGAKGPVVITTQAGPTESTFNFGGFTDGDRAVLMCEEFGSAGILLAGFDFDNPTDDAVEEKRAKLAFAKSIILDAASRGAPIEHLYAAGSVPGSA